MKAKRLVLPLLFVALGCTSFSETGNDAPQKNEKAEVSSKQEVIQIFELGAQGATLELLKDESENSITLQTKRNAYLISKAGCGNSEFIKNEEGSVKLDTLTFSKDEQVYLVTSYIRGSTYGAECYFIVFKKSEWLVMALPFNRARFYDLDQDGFDEIVEYKSQTDSAIHTFNSGIVCP